MGSWLAMSMVFPFSLSWRTMAMNSWESLVSRWAVGSSAMMMAGLLMRERAMATRWASPPESHSTLAAALWLMLKSARLSSALALSGAYFSPVG